MPSVDLKEVKDSTLIEELNERGYQVEEIFDADDEFKSELVNIYDAFRGGKTDIAISLTKDFIYDQTGRIA